MAVDTEREFRSQLLGIKLALEMRLRLRGGPLAERNLAMAAAEWLRIAADAAESNYGGPAARMEPRVNLGQALWRFAQGLDVSTYDAREIARSAADYLHNTASLPASRLVPEQRRGAL